MSWFTRPPDVVIGPPDSPYMLRWHLFQRNRWFNIYLHKFVKDDADRDLHDHQYWYLSLMLSGGYYEETDVHGVRCKRWIGPGSVSVRRPTHAHRVTLRRQQWRDPLTAPLSVDEMKAWIWSGVFRIIPAWTISVTGPRVREWGFHTAEGWIHWKEFVAKRGPDGSTYKA
jgi:hypothetical protein